VTAERLGVPAIGVMTERFASAAELMARVLGFPGYGFATIAHPISSATDADLRDMAAIAVTEVLRLLVLPGSPD
jgi:hypothetical protein